MERWEGRVAVVTGASEGIGEAIVRKLAASGMKVVALARRQQLLEALEKDVNSKLKGPGRCYVHTCDVSDEQQVKKAFAWIQANVGPVSVLINNAALFNFVDLKEINAKAVKETFDVNIMGVVNCCQQGLASMKAAGIDDGHIININSDLGHRDACMPGAAPYSASKHALTSFTGSLKRELGEAKSKIRVTSLSPGLVRTSMSSVFWKNNPGVGALEAGEVADGVLFALSVPKTVNVAELMMVPV